MLRVIFLGLVFLSGCATNSLTPAPVTEESLSDSVGIFVGSFSRDPSAPVYYSQTFFYKNVETGKIYQISSQPTFNIFSGKTPDDFSTPDSDGAIFVRSLPAGKYIYYNFNLYQSNGSYQQHWSSDEDYSIPFEIYPNSINYAGEIKLVSEVGRNIFNQRVNAGGYWIISDRQYRDLSIFASKYPDISVDKIIQVIPEQKEVFTPLVILPNELEGADLTSKQE